VANYFLDNDDIQFLCDHLDLAALACLQEEQFADAATGLYGDAPVDEADAVDNYRRILWVVGEIAGTSIAASAEVVDRAGNALNDDGTVTLHPLVRDNLDQLRQADLMGMTLPRKYGGLNCPTLLYTMAIEIVSRADASLMNLFGLQGIAETICSFASEEIKQDVLPRFARGEVTGAMVLTEPDAGSDLQAIRLRASQDDEGNWHLSGVKRFITNGCGDILLTLARSEPEISDGRGLSLFISERSEHIRVRHLENKLGIHGSPTCELVYENAPARLVGERRQGLTSYVLSLMNGARVGIAAQSLGIAEAAFRLARSYAHARQQFGGAIERLPAVAEMLVDMRVEIEVARALTYETAELCDRERDNLRRLERAEAGSDEWRQLKQRSIQLKRLNAMLTPMSKYYAAEMCCRVADSALQVLGGSGYMKDYPAERYLRDARITTIYEGTSQLQIVAAVRAVTSGAFEMWMADRTAGACDDPLLAKLGEELQDGRRRVLEAVEAVKKMPTRYLDLSGRRLVDAAAIVIMGQLLIEQGRANERKRHVACRFIRRALPTLRVGCDHVCSGDASVLDQFDLLAGPVPSDDSASRRIPEFLFRATGAL
jgi:alkylation response protein AidB-like acyl-CoA dehydrogenase